MKRGSKASFFLESKNSANGPTKKSWEKKSIDWKQREWLKKWNTPNANGLHQWCRLCRDYKLTVNKYANFETYSIPKITRWCPGIHSTWSAPHMSANRARQSITGAYNSKHYEGISPVHKVTTWDLDSTLMKTMLKFVYMEDVLVIRNDRKQELDSL